MQIAYRYRLSSRLTPRGIAAYSPETHKDIFKATRRRLSIAVMVYICPITSGTPIASQVL